MSNLMLDVDQAGELKAAFRRGDWTNQEIKRLSEGDTLAQFRKVMLGHAVITVTEHLIDCDAAPFVPSSWTVPEGHHQKSGQWKWDPKQVSLYLSKGQQDGKVFEGNKLRKELAGKLVFNANVLDYLLANQHFIPEGWKGKYVFFWGTIYRDSLGNLYVRCLYWYGDSWDWGVSRLYCAWRDNHPAALRAS